MNKKLKVAVLGCTGYVGMEIVKFLSMHPNVKINFLGSDSHYSKKFKYFNDNMGFQNLPTIQKYEDFNYNNSDCVFLALPHAISNKYVKKFFGNIKIIDLSADFRLKNYNEYLLNYGSEHTCFELSEKFTYGLAEINRDLISRSSNIAVPGCYPTSILLPLIPLLKDNLIKTNNIIIDSKSGYSGAGKKFDKKNIKNNNDFNFYNYNTNSHRHISEIHQEMSNSTDQKISFSFNPHILSSFRGMMSTIYCEINKSSNLEKIKIILSNFSQNNYFIDYIENDSKLDFFSIQNTNLCKIKIFKSYDHDKLIIVSIIDNLIKGAAGQAIQCLNISENINEKTSIV